MTEKCVDKIVKIVHFDNKIEDWSAEYTQSGDCRFLAYIPSRSKNQPWLVRVSRTKLQCTLLLRGLIHSPYFISTLYVLSGLIKRNVQSRLLQCTLFCLAIPYNCPFKSLFAGADPLLPAAEGGSPRSQRGAFRGQSPFQPFTQAVWDNPPRLSGRYDMAQDVLDYTVKKGYPFSRLQPGCH